MTSDPDPFKLPSFLRRVGTETGGDRDEANKITIPESAKAMVRERKQKQLEREERQKHHQELTAVRWKHRIERERDQLAVASAISRGHDSWEALRSVLVKEIPDKRLRSALRALVRQKKIDKVSRRRYRLAS